MVVRAHGLLTSFNGRRCFPPVRVGSVKGVGVGSGAGTETCRGFVVVGAISVTHGTTAVGVDAGTVAAVD